MVCRVKVGLEWEEEEMEILQSSYAPMGVGGGGGDTLIFYCYVELDQTSTVYPPFPPPPPHTQNQASPQK